MAQVAHIVHGGKLTSLKTSAGEEFRIDGLEFGDGLEVFVVLYQSRNPSKSAMAQPLNVNVSARSVQFSQQNLYDGLKAIYRDGDFIKPGTYEMRVHVPDGNLRDIMPPPSMNKVQLEIREG